MRYITVVGSLTLLGLLWVLPTGGSSPTNQQSVITASPHQLLGMPEIPDSLSVEIHFTHPRPDEIRMLAAAGFRRVRLDLVWARTEKSKGHYDFSRWDYLLSRLRPYGIGAYFILDYGNPLYDGGKPLTAPWPPVSSTARHAFCRWVAAAVRHFHGQGIIWEMWNEPNISGFWFPKPDAAAYARLAVAVGKTIRKVSPNAVYVGPALSGCYNGGPIDFLKTCFQAGILKYWNAVSVHPYIGFGQSNVGPEGVVPEYNVLRKLIAHYAPPGRHIPILSGEWGYTSTWYHGDNSQQARYAIREFLMNLYQRIPFINYYDWHDDGAAPGNREDNFGLVDFKYHPGRTPPYTPKPIYGAIKTLTMVLHKCHFVRRMPTGAPTEYVLLFAGPDGNRIAAWSVGNKPHDVAVVLPGVKRCRLISEMNVNDRVVAAHNGKLSLRITHNPEYLIPIAPR